MASFPISLPSITPTLQDLTSLVFAPLLEHTARLSGTLLSVFLCPTSPLNFPAHLVLLRSYLLLTSHSFRSRLAAALFSDSAGDGVSSDVKTRGRHGKRGDRVAKEKAWAVGLASALTERETWPPGGSDLSFLLRTVIVDSLELGYTRDVVQSDRGVALAEAESRLAFAIRDLPMGPGRSQWLNPLCEFIASYSVGPAD
jgi:Gamma tubulin complex component C-terminal